MAGRDPLFKCSICGKYISYEDIGTERVNQELGTEMDTALEVVEMYHRKCYQQETTSEASPTTEDK